MPIHAEIQEAGDLLRVVASGRNSGPEDVRDYGQSVLEAVVASSCRRVICDERELEYAMDPFDTCEAARFLAESVPRVVRVALVCRSRYLEDARFWETVAVNRGLQVRVFSDPREAEAWVMDGN